jgi:hypothetical protein
MLGTVAYMSPEPAAQRGACRVDGRQDTRSQEQISYLPARSDRRPAALNLGDTKVISWISGPKQ